MTTAMSALEAPNDYVARLKALQDVEAERKKIIDEILDEYSRLKKENESLQSDIENIKIAANYHRKEKEEKTKELKELMIAQESNPLVGVFVDGDGAKFQESLIKDGVTGGEKAAHALQEEIRKHLRDAYPDRDTNTWKIMAVVIASMDNLANTYQRHLGHKADFRSTTFTAALRQFAVGFNRGAHHTFSFVDIGGSKNLKELTDTKLKETFLLMFPHCKHVFFAGCHDSGYVSFLSPYKHDPKTVSKLTLIETHNTNPNYHSLGFRMTSFADIFRPEDFPPSEGLPRSSTGGCSPPAAHNVPRASSIDESSFPVPLVSSNGTSASNQGSSWATVGKVGIADGKVISIAPTKKSVPQKTYYLVNRDGERVDAQLPTSSPIAWKRFERRVEEQGMNFCNDCALFGPDTCSQTRERHKHGNPNLSEEEFLVLQHKVRNIKCAWETGCEDPGCPYSHHCKFGRFCTQGNSCRWASTHHVDTRPYKRVYNDGTAELVD